MRITASLPDSTGCTGVPIALQYNIQNADSATIDWGDGTLRQGLANPLFGPTTFTRTHSYAAAGRYVITLHGFTRDSCQADYTGQIHIYNTPAFSLALGDSVVCPGFANVLYANLAFNIDVVQASWQALPNGPATTALLSNLAPGPHTLTAPAYMTPGSYRVVLSAQNGPHCVFDTLLTYRVAAPPVPAFTFTDTARCLRHDITLTNTSQNATACLVLWGDGASTAPVAVGAQASHSYTQSGTYTLAMVATTQEGCRDTARQTLAIAVRPKPTATTFWTVPTGCEPLATSLHYNVTDADTATILWGDGSPAEPLPATGLVDSGAMPHTFATQGTYVAHLSLRTKEGCRQTVNIPLLKVLPAVDAQVMLMWPRSGCPPLTEYISGPRLGLTADSATLDWADGSPPERITAAQAALRKHVFTKPGTYYPRLMAGNGYCTDTFLDTLRVQGVGAIAGFAYATVLADTLHTDHTQALPDPVGNERVQIGWHAAPDVAAWRISRAPSVQGSPTAKPTLIARVAGSDTLYIDEAAEPAFSAYAYLLEAEDSCGKTYPAPLLAQTMLLAKQTTPWPSAQIGWSPYTRFDGLPDGYVLLAGPVAYVNPNGNDMELPRYLSTGAWAQMPLQQPALTAARLVDAFTDTLGALACRISLANPATGFAANSNTLLLRVEDTVFIPTAFTPNGDGLNDVWYVRGRGLTQLNVRIFSRWGQEVWQGNPIRTPWDGTLNGAPLEQGFYEVLLRYQTVTREWKQVHASLSVLR